MQINQPEPYIFVPQDNENPLLPATSPCDRGIEELFCTILDSNEIETLWQKTGAFCDYMINDLQQGLEIVNTAIERHQILTDLSLGVIMRDFEQLYAQSDVDSDTSDAFDRKVTRLENVMCLQTQNIVDLIQARETAFNSLHTPQIKCFALRLAQHRWLLEECSKELDLLEKGKEHEESMKKRMDEIWLKITEQRTSHQRDRQQFNDEAERKKGAHFSETERFNRQRQQSQLEQMKKGLEVKKKERESLLRSESEKSEKKTTKELTAIQKQKAKIRNQNGPDEQEIALYANTCKKNIKNLEAEIIIIGNDLDRSKRREMKEHHKHIKQINGDIDEIKAFLKMDKREACQHLKNLNASKKKVSNE